MNQDLLALVQFGAHRNVSANAELLDQLCTPCMDLVLSEAAGFVQALAGLLESVEHLGLPGAWSDRLEILLMARDVPTLCTRAARWRDAVCVRVERFGRRGTEPY